MIRELTKVEQMHGLWVVKLLSSVTGQWMVVSEWVSKEQAETDRKNWL